MYRVWVGEMCIESGLDKSVLGQGWRNEYKVRVGELIIESGLEK